MNIYQKILPHEKYERIELSHDFLNGFGEIISFITMNYHYTILHKNYETKLLETLRGRKNQKESEIEKKYPTLIKLMENLEQLPEEIRNKVRFYGGGVINHNFYFAHLIEYKPNRKKHELEKKISPSLLKLIQEKFVNLESLKKELVNSASQVWGSGGTGLVLNRSDKLEIINTEKQDGPWALHLRPLIGIDVGEHAYFSDYGPRREEYVKNSVDYLLNGEYISWLYLNYTSNQRVVFLDPDF